MITSVLSDYYKDTVVPQLKEKRGYKNPMEIPKLVKIVINTGVGTDKDREVMTAAVETHLAQPDVNGGCIRCRVV